VPISTIRRNSTKTPDAPSLHSDASDSAQSLAVVGALGK